MIYLICFAISVFFAHQVDKRIDNNKPYMRYALFAVLMPILLAGVRSKYIGLDTDGYVTSNYYLSCSFSSLSKYLNYEGTGTDIGFLVFVYFITNLFGNLFSVMVTNHILIYVPLFIFLVYYKKKLGIPIWFAYTIALLYQYNMSLCVIRQSMSISIALLAICAFQEKKILWFLLLSLISISIHFTSIILILVFIGFSYITRYNRNKKRAFALALLMLLSLVVINNLMNPILAIVDSKYADRLEQATGNEGGILTLSFWGLLAIWPYVQFYFFRAKIRYNEAVLYMPLIGFIFMILGHQSIYIGRVAYPFILMNAVTIPYTIRKVQLRACVIFALFILWYVSIILRNDWGTMPYVVGDNLNF